MSLGKEIRLLQPIGSYTVGFGGKPAIYMAQDHPFLRDLADRKARKGGALVCEYVLTAEEELEGKQCECYGKKYDKRCEWGYVAGRARNAGDNGILKVITPTDKPWISRLRGAKLIVCPKHYNKIMKEDWMPKTVRG